MGARYHIRLFCAIPDVLARTKQTKGALTTMAFAVLNLILAFSFVTIPWELNRLHLISPDYIAWESAFSTLNFGDALLAGALFVVALLALLHRVLWPVFERPVYKLAESIGHGHKKLLFAAGTALLVFAVGRVPDWLKKVFETFVG
jgi:hypothetical protein